MGTDACSRQGINFIFDRPATRQRGIILVPPPPLRSAFPVLSQHWLPPPLSPCLPPVASHALCLTTASTRSPSLTAAAPLPGDRRQDIPRRAIGLSPPEDRWTPDGRSPASLRPERAWGAFRRLFPILTSLSESPGAYSICLPNLRISFDSIRRPRVLLRRVLCPHLLAGRGPGLSAH